MEKLSSIIILFLASIPLTQFIFEDNPSRNCYEQSILLKTDLGEEDKVDDFKDLEYKSLEDLKFNNDLDIILDLEKESNLINVNNFKSHCWCRILVFQGTDLKKLPNSLVDLGPSLKEYKGFVTRKKQDECASLCGKRAREVNKSDDYYCEKIGRPGRHRIVAYSKVGMKDWRTCDELGDVNCCISSGEILCPQGMIPDKNGPGKRKCQEYVCQISSNPLPPTNTRIGNWGFTWNDQIIRWMPALKITPARVVSCK